MMKNIPANISLLRLPILMASCLTLAGCANWFTPMGENNYDCNRKENPDSPYCHSFKAVDDATTEPIPDSRYDQRASVAEADKLNGIAPKKKKGASKDASPQSLPSVSLNDSGSIYSLPEGSPVRAGPIVQRVWIKSYADKNDMLTGDVVVYKEIVPPHWSGHGAANTAPSTGADGWPTGTYPHYPVPQAPVSATLSQPQSAASQQDSQLRFTQPGTETFDVRPQSAKNDQSSMPQ